MRSTFPFTPICFGVVARKVPGVPRRRAFTLVELLVVIAVIVVVMAMVVPAFVQVDAGRQLTLAAYNISGVLENARAYAKANSTYTWVGFFEEDGSKSSANPAVSGKGRIIISVVASKDATAMYPVRGDQLPLDGFNLVQIGNLLKINNMHLEVLTQSDVPARAAVDNGSQVGSDDFNSHGGQGASNKATFNYPIGATAAAATYTFVKIVQFNPLGDAAKIVDSPTPLVEIGVRPARGNVVSTNSKNLAAIQITGIGGAVRIYQR